jgi:hypothetical protein
MNTAATVARFDSAPSSAPMRPRFDRRFRAGVADGRRHSAAGSRRARQISESVQNAAQHTAAVRRLSTGGVA